jgi:hypothetical protein
MINHHRHWSARLEKNVLCSTAMPHIRKLSECIRAAIAGNRFRMGRQKLHRPEPETRLERNLRHVGFVLFLIVVLGTVLAN